jgi:excisionase family DNA binding protein
MSSYWDIRQLSAYLNVKPSTLYAWVAQGKIPCRKIHRLVRFDPNEIDRWLALLLPRHPSPDRQQERTALVILIASAKRAVYTSGHGETRPKSSLIGKGERDGALEA